MKSNGLDWINTSGQNLHFGAHLKVLTWTFGLCWGNKFSWAPLIPSKESLKIPPEACGCYQKHPFEVTRFKRCNSCGNQEWLWQRQFFPSKYHNGFGIGWELSGLFNGFYTNLPVWLTSSFFNTNDVDKRSGVVLNWYLVAVWLGLHWWLQVFWWSINMEETQNLMPYMGSEWVRFVFCLANLLSRSKQSENNVRTNSSSYGERTVWQNMQ